MALALAGKRILVVEDQFLLASALAEFLEFAGAEVIGPCPTVASAITVLKSGKPLDVAVLDVQLDSETSEPIVDLAKSMGVPVLLMTGYDQTALPDTLRGLPSCIKPFDPRELVERLEQLSAHATCGDSVPQEAACIPPSPPHSAERSPDDS